MVFAIDPGNIESAYVVIDDDYKPVEFGKVPNNELRAILRAEKRDCHVVIEMIDSYGMAVGKDVFETCLWIGRFTEVAIQYFGTVNYIYRKEEKINLCGSMKAKDTNIRQALIDRFGIVGTQKSKGWFYGFKADIWAAYAVGVTYLDKGGNKN